MSAATFTPGPWVRDQYGNLLGPNGRNVMFRSVAICCSGPSVAEAEANTNLAAAAPDLLAFAYWFVENRDGPGTTLARAAIAKATPP